METVWYYYGGYEPYGHIFEDADLGNATLYVPHPSLGAYNEADIWKDFGIITSNADASLRSLTVDNVTLSPLFNKDILNYSGTVSNAVSGISVTAVSRNPFAAVTVTGAGSLEVGDNSIAVTVVSENGNHRQDYAIAVHRKSADASLKSLLLNNGNISFDFSPAVFSYMLTVPNTVPVITLSAETNHSLATVTSGTGDCSLSFGNK